MKIGKKTIKTGKPVRRTHKTKEDFMRWWREQEALKKRPSFSPSAEALMEWVDDGGST